MTYSAGSLIQATDYNGFVSATAGANINAVLTNYGQTTVSTISPAATVTATQWSTLNSTLAALAAHQGTAITSRSSPVAGDTINVLANINTDLTAINTNYLNAASQGTQYTAWSGTASLTSGYGSGQSAWTATFTDVVSFSSTAALTAFFNAGGTVAIQFGKTSTGTVADTEWNAFIPKLGTVYLTSRGTTKTIAGVSYDGVKKVGGSGSATINTGTGALDLTSTPTQLFLQYDDGGSVYSNNYVQVYGSVSGSTLTITTYWHSNGDTNPGAVANISGGTATTGIVFGTAASTVVTYNPPESTNITNSWGVPTVSSSVA